MFLFIFIYFLLFNSTLSILLSNTYIFSGRPNSYVAFDAWRPCLTGYVRFDIRTNAQDGTLAYIDDRGKFDFFYLKLIEGKLRLLFNLGNDRQALNVNMKVNDDKWHTILIKRNGQTTMLSIDNGRAQNSTMTHSEDLYFGGAVYNEYQASPFYFGGIPTVLERPSSGNLSSFDVYMQPRFRGQVRNLIYKNCTNSHLTQPSPMDISDGVSLIPNQYCLSRLCGVGICLINDHSYTCLCDETYYQGTHCQYERQTNELTLHGRQYFRYNLVNLKASLSELITFEFKTNQYDGLLFQLIDSTAYIKLKSGQLAIEYRWKNLSYDFPTKNLHLIDNQWHYVQMNRKPEQTTVIIDQYYFEFEHDIQIDQPFNYTEIFIGGNHDLNIEKFYGCLKDISILFNENVTININQTSKQMFEYGLTSNRNCKTLISPIQFLVPSSFVSFELPKFSQELNMSFRFETYSSDCVLLYSQSNQDFLGFDLIDGFLFLTFNVDKKRQRQELFQQRFNDGQSHYVQLELRMSQAGLELNIMIDYRQNTRMSIRSLSSKLNLQTLTIGSVNPMLQWLPTNYFSGIMHRGFIGCFSNLEINNEFINLENYINYTVSSTHIIPKSGPCSTALSRKPKCQCENNGECRMNNGGKWFCDCSKTGYTGQQCEQLAYHLDLSQFQAYELNTNIQWSEHISDISFRLQALHDGEDFLQIRPCPLSLHCDSINFSIRNGLLYVHFYLLNPTIEHPFLLDNKWHSIHLQRIDTSFILHVDSHVIQQRVNVINLNASSSSTLWLIFYGHKQIRIEDLRLYGHSIYSKFFLHNKYEPNKLKHRPWKPSNTISFDGHQNSFIEIHLNDILCQDCQLDTLYFQFRTIESNGLLLFANIKTNNPKTNFLSDGEANKKHQELILKLVNGQLYLIIFDSALPKTYNEIYQLPTKVHLDNNQWHHIFLHRASDHHLELIIDSHEHYLLTSIFFLDTIYFGLPVNIQHLNHMSTIKACFASLTINSHPINLREYIKPNSPIRNDCFLDSQCPLEQCQNTGTCLDRIQCDCQHTSFQGRFCTDLRLGYAFNDQSSGLVFDQPFIQEKLFSTYQLSFGIVTKTKRAELIRINDQLSIELMNGFIRVKFHGNDYLQNERLVNDGFYHLVQIQYNKTKFISINVDSKSQKRQLHNEIFLDRPLSLLIGQHPTFKYPFQGQLYGLESDIYSVFDLISPTFQRISFTPVRNKTLPSSPSYYSSIIHPTFETKNNLSQTLCSYQPYDDICIITSDTYSTPLSYPNMSMESFLSFSSSSNLSMRIPSDSIDRSSFKSPFTSTLPYQQITYKLTATGSHSMSSSVASFDTNDTPSWIGKFHWKNILFIVLPVFIGIIICTLLFVFACMKYRRKDAGVYELEEAQRFRPLIVQLSPLPGENNSHDAPTSTANTVKKTKRKSSTRQNSKTPPSLKTDTQREFYI